jgi:hypothetical protein
LFGVKWVVHLHETQPVEVENSALSDLDRVVESCQAPAQIDCLNCIEAFRGRLGRHFVGNLGLGVRARNRALFPPDAKPRNRSRHILSGGLIGRRRGDVWSFEQRATISPARGAKRCDGQNCDQQQDARASLRCRRRALSEDGRGRTEKAGRSNRRCVEQPVVCTRPAISRPIGN